MGLEGGIKEHTFLVISGMLEFPGRAPVCTDNEFKGSWKSQYQEEHSVKRREKKGNKIVEFMKRRQEFGQTPK